MKKILFFISYLVLNVCHAENWLNHSKIKSGSVEAYSLKSDCERISGEECFDLGDNPSAVFVEFDKEIDDLSKPIFSKNEIQSCASIGECDQIHSSKVCSNKFESSIKNYKLLEVYCSAIIGHEKKKIKSIKLDEEKAQKLKDKKKVELDAFELEKKRRQDLKLSIESINWAEIKTIADLKNVLKNIIEMNK